MGSRSRHRRITQGLALASGLGWGLVVLSDHSPLLPRLCTPGGWSLAAHGTAALQINPVGPLIASYAAMVIAMMAPLVKEPLREVSDRSVRARRRMALGAFVIGYGAVWAMLAPLFGAIIVWIVAGPLSSTVLPTIIAAAMVLLWHASPARQYALNRCHRFVAPFVGPDDSLWPMVVEGWKHGLACAAACAPLMVIAMTVEQAHLAAMALASVFLWLERRLPPERLAWGLRPLKRTLSSLSYLLRRLAANLAIKVRAIG